MLESFFPNMNVRDRRSLGASPKPSGVLVGHTEGITNVSAKGDGRYIISNGKDQALRLWDLRKMCSSEDFDNGANRNCRLGGYDYRCVDSSSGKNEAHMFGQATVITRNRSVPRTHMIAAL